MGKRGIKKGTKWSESRRKAYEVRHGARNQETGVSEPNSTIVEATKDIKSPAA